MSDIYTEYFRSLPTDGRPPDETLALKVLVQLRKDLKRLLRHRFLWNHSPSLLGFLGNSWNEDDTLDDLVHECYLHVFGKRLKHLRSQLRVRDNIDGLVNLNLWHKLTDLQRKADPIGYQVFEHLSSVIKDATKIGDLHVLSGDDRIRNDTVLAFSPDTDPKRVVGTAELEDLVLTWSKNLLPDLITGRSHRVTRVRKRIRAHVLALGGRGVEAFRFRDVVLPFQKDVRWRWAAVLEVDGGEAGVEFNSEGLREMVRVFQPVAYDDSRSFEWILKCVPQSIDSRKEETKTNREALWKLWEYFRSLAFSSEGKQGKLLSSKKLGEFLRIDRKRVPALLKILRKMVEACRERERRGAEVRPIRNRQARRPASKTVVGKPQAPPARRIQS